jgi:hypothetical protein
VDGTGTIDGAWWFTVRWRTYIPIPNTFPREAGEYSTNLWESDLALFEVVSNLEKEEARKKQLEAQSLFPLASYPSLGGGWQARRRSGVHPQQLTLFLADDFE